MLAAGLSYRESGPADGPPVLLLHGFPESSFMWERLMHALADVGRRALAPDLAGFGGSEPDRPGTWERHVESVERFRRELEVERCVLVVHDWGGLIGLRWALDNPGVASALVISGTGFFPDGRWHGMAQALREQGTGETVIDSLDRDGFAALLRGTSSGVTDAAIDDYWRGFADESRRRSHLEMYRSGDFSKLDDYDLATLGVPALLVWGEDDQFAPVASAHRFARELPAAELAVIEGAGHFVWEDAPERCAEAVIAWLSGI